MNVLALKVLLAPALVGASTLLAWRFGPRAGGWLSSLPVIAGPVLLVYSSEHGSRYAEQAAAGTLVGLVGLSLFIAIYARLAARQAAGVCLMAGWMAFFALTALTAGWRPPAALAAALAFGSFALAGVATRTPTVSAAPWVNPVSWKAAAGLRMVSTGLLVWGLSELGGALPPRLGGVLVAFPVLASILAAFTHRDEGGRAAAALLRGMLLGLVSFAGFCLVVGLVSSKIGITAAFSVAALTAIAVQVGTLPLARLGSAERRGGQQARQSRRIVVHDGEARLHRHSVSGLRALTTLLRRHARAASRRARAL